jgi:hypothetical protein
MSEYRNRTTGEVKTQGEWRKLNPNVSLPRVWNQNVFDTLDIDPVLAGAKPTEVGTYQTVVRDGVVQDANDNWVENWVVRDMFQDDEDGTKAEKEAAYQAELDEREATSNRSYRNTLLEETDWTALSDVTMSTEMATYRQALRDITTHANWPNIQPDDWPTKP